MEAVESSEHEVLIVGAGPAGLSAALVFGRALVDTVLIDAGKPRAAVTASTHGFLSRDGAPAAHFVEIVSGWSEDLVGFTNGRELLDAEDRARLERGGVRVETAPIAGLAHEGGRLRAVELADGSSVPRAGGFVATAGAEAVLPLAERLAGRERVYFAGDVELGFAGIAESAGDGYRVAKSIVKEIAKERWERA